MSERGRLLRTLAGAVLGVLLLPGYLVAIVAAVFSRRPALFVTDLEARRLTWADGTVRERRPQGRRLYGHLAVRTGLAVLNGYILVLIALGAVFAVVMVVGAATAGPVALIGSGPGEVDWRTVAFFVLPGLFGLFLVISGLMATVWIDRRSWVTFTRPGAGELERQVGRLSEAIDAERRRIERDLHDGVQQRVVALSILLARGERSTDPAEQAGLYRRARTEAQEILADLRGVAWRIYPAMLARDGLAAALEALRERTPVPVRLHTEAVGALGPATEAAAFFVASEAVTNVIKHAQASRVEIQVAREAGNLVVTVRDDGVGGADPAGPGLSGIAARVAARGGQLRVESPVGGPTAVRAAIPCG